LRRDPRLLSLDYEAALQSRGDFAAFSEVPWFGALPLRHKHLRARADARTDVNASARDRHVYNELPLVARHYTVRPRILDEFSTSRDVLAPCFASSPRWFRPSAPPSVLAATSFSRTSPFGSNLPRSCKSAGR